MPQIIPGLRNWEEVLFLTDVPNWTPHAVFQATRLFVSSLNARLVRALNLPVLCLNGLQWTGLARSAASVVSLQGVETLPRLPQLLEPDGSS